MNERLKPWTKAEDYAKPPERDMDALRIENSVAREIIGEIQEAKSFVELRDLEEKAFNKKGPKVDVSERISEVEWKSIQLEVERHVISMITDMAVKGDDPLKALEEVVMLFSPHSRVVAKAIRVVEDQAKKVVRGGDGA